MAPRKSPPEKEDERPKLDVNDVEASAKLISALAHPTSEQIHAKLEIDKIEMVARVEREKLETAARLEQERIDHNEKVAKDRIIFRVVLLFIFIVSAWAIYTITMSANVDDKKWAQTVLSSLLSAFSGYLIGKSMSQSK